MAPKILQFIQKLFRTNWKRQIEYGQTISPRRNSNCVLKSMSSKSSLSDSTCSLAPRHACSMDSINFEFRTPKDKPDLCCVRKCCEKCFCEEGEALAEDVRRKSRRRKKLNAKTVKKFTSAQGRKCSCSLPNRPGSTGSRGSSDSAFEVTSASSCEDASCQFRREVEKNMRGVQVEAFAHIHARACASSEYETLTPKYENVPDTDTKTISTETEPPYDFVPARPPRAITEPRYENVLSVNCIDACVFRQISSLIDATSNPAEVVESLQLLHKNYSCVRRTSSADNEINYYFENYDELENDLNMELERRLSD